MDKLTLGTRNVSIEFPGVKALTDVNFEVSTGEIRALVGANGAGKSTLMKVFAGANPDYTGEVYLNDKVVELRTPMAAKKLGIQIVYQEVDMALVPTLSVAENVMLNDMVMSAKGKPLMNWAQLRTDAKRVLELLNGRIPQYHHAEWTEYVQALRPAQEPESGARLTPQQVLETIRRLAPPDTIVSTDVGQHQMWAIQHLHFDYPGQLLTSGGFGTMGFGLGAAIGAKQGNPDKTVIHITGDGCFRMNGNELATEAYYGLPVITVIFNNRNLGMVRQWQSLIYDHRYSQTSLENRSPDFVKFADAFGLKGRRVTQPSELEEAITEALAESAQGRGYVIDCAINADEMVHPMVNGGHHITEFLLS